MQWVIFFLLPIYTALAGGGEVMKGICFNTCKICLVNDPIRLVISNFHKDKPKWVSGHCFSVCFLQWLLKASLKPSASKLACIKQLKVTDFPTSFYVQSEYFPLHTWKYREENSRQPKTPTWRYYKSQTDNADQRLPFRNKAQKLISTKTTPLLWFALTLQARHFNIPVARRREKLQLESSLKPKTQSRNTQGSYSDPLL